MASLCRGLQERDIILMYVQNKMAKIHQSKRSFLPKEGYGLRALDLELTAHCNLRCIHCYLDSSLPSKEEEKIPKEKWKAIIDESVELGTEILQITGGEPTLNKDFSGILEYASQKNYRKIKIYTNAYGLNEETRRVIKRSRALVSVSFYSANPQVYDLITRVEGSFEGTVGTLNRMIKENIPLRARIILTPYNDSQKDIESTIQLLNSLGIFDVKSDIVHGVGRALKLKEEDPYSALCGSCWAGKLAISSTGEIYPCIMSRFMNLGNIFVDSLSDVLKDPRLAEFRIKVYDKYQRRE